MVISSHRMESGSLIPTEAMFPSGFHKETGLEFADEDAVATLVVGISAAGMQTHLCCPEFPLSSVVCEGFPWLLSSRCSSVSRVCDISCY